ncbi:MAG: hypothetical protein M3151_13425, partial [Actinomycetota bacterium]|nr:hypothetical protein [Actinomycetota bacterium]
LPAVVCGTGCPRECIQPGVSGFATAPGNEEEFFSRIEVLLDDVAARRRMGLAACKFAETIGWEAVPEDMMELHSGLAGVPLDLTASL